MGQCRRKGFPSIIAATTAVLKAAKDGKLQHFAFTPTGDGVKQRATLKVSFCADCHQYHVHEEQRKRP